MINIPIEGRKRLTKRDKEIISAMVSDEDMTYTIAALLAKKREADEKPSAALADCLQLND